MREHAQTKKQTSAGTANTHATWVPGALSHQAQWRHALRKAGVQPRLETEAADEVSEGKAQASPSLETQLNSLSSGGVPLDAPSRAFFEPRFGHDFSQVRLHTDFHASRMAEALGAQAFTLGNHIAFGAGRHSPATAAGKNLLGHELAHVVQQRGMPAQARRLQCKEANLWHPNMLDRKQEAERLQDLMQCGDYTHLLQCGGEVADEKEAHRREALIELYHWLMSQSQDSYVGDIYPALLPASAVRSNYSAAARYTARTPVDNRVRWTLQTTMVQYALQHGYGELTTKAMNPMFSHQIHDVAFQYANNVPTIRGCF